MTNNQTVKKVFFSLSVLLLLGIGCKKQATDSEQQSAWSNLKAVDPNDIAEILVRDGEFNLFQVAINKLAIEKSKNAEVIILAKSLQSQYLQAQQATKSLATKHKLELSEDISAVENKKLSSLSTLELANFDRKYISLIMEEHNNAIDSMFKVYKETKDNEVKVLAYNSLDLLRNHLAEVIRVQHTLK